MKIIMVAVISTNGKITRGLERNIYEWSSQEDKDHFAKLRDENNLIVMGSGTYEAVKSFIELSLEKLRIVLTSSPEKYKNEEIKGQLEFTSESPRELYNRCMIDHTKMLLVGGAKVYSSFIKGGLVDEIYLTVEPVIFGKGKPLFADGDFDVNLKLVSSKKLNKNGTLLLKYIVKK